MESDKTFLEIMLQLPSSFRRWSSLVPIELQPRLTELRLFRGQQPLWMEARKGYHFGQEVITPTQMQELYLAVCQGSVHSFQQEIREGFVTLKGGHRVGLCGTAVFHHGEQSGLRDITSLNIRFARQHRGCAEELYRRLKEQSLERSSFLLVGPPASGKTSLLRDLCRILSEQGSICALLDERGELTDFDLGPSTHVLKGLPKEKALLQALRCLSPEVILCDEIGTLEEAELLCRGLNSGCRFIATIHGEKLQSLLRKPQLRPLIKQGALDALILVEPLGQIKTIMEVKGNASAGLYADPSLGLSGRALPQTEAGAGAAALGQPSLLSSAGVDGASDLSLHQPGDPEQGSLTL